MTDENPIASNQSFFQGPANLGGAEAWAEYQQLERSQWWIMREMEDLQFRQLRDMLNHCEQHVPYYREAFAEHGISVSEISSIDDLRRLPILDRSQYAQSQRRLRATSLPAGTCRNGELSTSGTTGFSVSVDRTNVTARKWVAFALRDLKWSGLNPLGRLASIRPSLTSGRQLERLVKGIDLPNWGSSFAQVIATGPSHYLDMTAEPADQLAWLQRIDPDYLVSFPSNVEHLARLAQQRRVRLPNLKRIQTIGESLLPEVRSEIQQMLGVPVVDTYSCSEAGYVASPCAEGHGYHVHGENVIVEVLGDDNQPCEVGETGRIVLTTLHNSATPLIRYDIHDTATVGGACACGRGLPLLTQISGRRRPLFVLPDGQTRSSTLLPGVIRSIGGFLQFQAAQTAPNRCVIRVVPDETWDELRCRKMIDAVSACLGNSIQCSVDSMERIPLPAGGKLQSTVVEFDANTSTTTDVTQDAKMKPQPSPPAVVYACSSAPLMAKTRRSAASFSNHMPQLRRVLWRTPDCGAVAENESTFDEIITIDSPAYRHRPRFEAMLNCDAERALFIDGDTLLVEPVPELFETLDQFDIALCTAPQRFHSLALRNRIYDHLPHVSSAVPEWNAGMIVARINDRFRRFVRRWMELFDVCLSLQYSMDQPALRAALATSDLRIATLPNNYNFRTMMPQVIKGSVKILHAHDDLPKLAARINRVTDLRIYSPQRPAQMQASTKTTPGQT
ncbi:MAG: hypothetical protein R3C59_04725 [Planctomycetaceae bacterium]